jgi:hypothetical protein
MAVVPEAAAVPAAAAVQVVEVVMLAATAALPAQQRMATPRVVLAQAPAPVQARVLPAVLAWVAQVRAAARRAEQPPA